MRNRLTILIKAPCLLAIFLSLSASKMLADSHQAKIDEYIEKESSIIINADSLEDRLISYLSRGDSYLIQGDFERAFQDYHNVYVLKDHLLLEDQDFFSFWALMGEAISLSNQEEYSLADTRIFEIKHSIQPLS